VWVLLQVCLDWKNIKSMFFKCFFFQNRLKAPKKHQIDAFTAQTQYKLKCVHIWGLSEPRKKKKKKLQQGIYCGNALGYSIISCNLSLHALSLKISVSEEVSITLLCTLSPTFLIVICWGSNLWFLFSNVHRMKLWDS
jgi:hypothetical protein